ncbi:MAG TPA: phytoene desaturase family protein [Candidatus Baltobacteraceae bacterium]|nr:phytoene desaturase family protein [Candidatus Baltobacteraceae bacterium]
MKSVCVVGAGFAGLSAALHLARRGMQVTVVESGPGAGGRARRIVTSKGFSFDAGPTIVVMTDALRSLLGEDDFAQLGLRRIDPGYRVLWDDGAYFDMHSHLAAFLEEIARFEGFDRRAAAVRYLADVHEQYVQARAKILEIDHTAQSFAKTILSRGRFAPWSLGRLQPFARRFFKNERVVQALTFQPLYLGTSPLKAPAMYALLAVEEIAGGVWYCPGGTGAIVDALVQRCERTGVRFVFDAPVERVVHENGWASAIECGSSRIAADGVVITADREPAARTMFGAPLRERRMRYGHSAIVWYASIRGSVHLPHHSVMLSNDPARAYAQLDAARLPDEPLVYVCNSSLSDSSAAPAGHSALMLLAPVPNASALGTFDETAFFDRVLARVERHAGALRDRLLDVQSCGPREFAALGLAHGAAFGPDHTLDQMGPFRPPIRHPNIANVVFAGSGTRPGSGIPMVLISGRLAAQRLAEAIA